MISALLLGVYVATTVLLGVLFYRDREEWRPLLAHGDKGLIAMMFAAALWPLFPIVLAVECYRNRKRKRS